MYTIYVFVVMYWLLGRKYKLSTRTNSSSTKLYSNQSGPTEYNSGQPHPRLTYKDSNAVRMIMHASWYMSNTITRKDLQIPTVKHGTSRCSYQYSKRLSVHPNELILYLYVISCIVASCCTRLTFININEVHQYATIFIFSS
jgi:hypothetical protein